MANWSELPADLVSQFEKPLSCVADVLRFRVVSKSWRTSILVESEKTFAPWLMLTKNENDHMPDGNEEEEEKKGGIIRCCISLADHKVFHLQLPQLQGRRCWGTRYGWLFTLGLDQKLSLFNPLTKQHIHLPPLSTFRKPRKGSFVDNVHRCRSFITNFALSSNPSDSSSSSSSSSPLIVMVVYGGNCELAFASPGDQEWTSLNRDTHLADGDVIFFKHHFYSVNVQGTLRVCHIDHPLEAQDVASPPDSLDLCDTIYLVEISGDLHLVARKLLEVKLDESEEWEEYFEYREVTESFQVFRFDFNKIKWTLVDHLDGHVLFLGNNQAFAISTLDYSNFKPNCIYFTDDHYVLYSDIPYNDMGVYDYRNKTILEPFYQDNVAAPAAEDTNLSAFSRPFFFMPSLSN